MNSIRVPPSAAIDFRVRIWSRFEENMTTSPDAPPPDNEYLTPLSTHAGLDSLKIKVAAGGLLVILVILSWALDNVDWEKSVCLTILRAFMDAMLIACAAALGAIAGFDLQRRYGDGAGRTSTRHCATCGGTEGTLRPCRDCNAPVCGECSTPYSEEMVCPACRRIRNANGG